MKKAMFFLIFCCIFVNCAFAEDEKIDPASYICAELIALNVKGEPPVFQGLQIDGFACGKKGQTSADPLTLPDMLIAVSNSCAADPSGKVLEHWENARKKYPVFQEGSWNASKTICKDYNSNPDDGSGFIIWLDGYVRGKTGKTASVLKDQETLDNFLAACKNNPDKLIIDVLTDNAR